MKKSHLLMPLVVLVSMADQWPEAMAQTGGMEYFTGFARATAPLLGRPVTTGPMPEHWKNIARRINRKTNVTLYIEDPKGIDLWKTPAEFYKQGGDCEDFAVAKYYYLRGLKVPESQMHIAVVMIKGTQQMHAVLLVGDEVLDIMKAEPQPMSYLRANYDVAYTINRLGWEKGDSADWIITMAGK